MSNPTAIRIGAALVLVVTSIGLADYFLKERPHRQIAVEQSTPTEVPASSAGSSMQSSASDGPVPVPEQQASSEAMASSMASENVPPAEEQPVRRVVKKGVSTKKKGSVDVQALLATLQFIPQETQEKSLLGDTATTTVVLLTDNDRAAFFSWVESADAKSILSSLKQALQDRFSPELKDLMDETRTQESGPPVDVLSFFDPAISPEKVMFIRVRNRLYEFHIADRGRDAIDRLIAELSK